jgi:hypothetical protein
MGDTIDFACWHVYQPSYSQPVMYFFLLLLLPLHCTLCYIVAAAISSCVLLLLSFACCGLHIELPAVGLSYLLLLVLDLPLLVAALLLPPAYSFLPWRLHSRPYSR